MSPPKATMGILLPVSPDIATDIHVASRNGFHFVVTPIVHPLFRAKEQIAVPSTLPRAQGMPESVEETLSRSFAFTRSDLLMSSSDWGRWVIALLSRDLNLDCNDTNVRRRDEERLKRELHYCQHLGLPAMMISLTKPRNVNFARLIYSFVAKSHSSTQVWVRIPLFGSGKTDTWDWWDEFRCVGNTDKRLAVSLEIDSDQSLDETRLKRWLGEPVKNIVISTRLFLTNKKGYPVLPRSVQLMVRPFIPMGVQVILEGKPRGHDPKFYQSYIDHLWQQQDSHDPVKQFAKGYEEFIQNPLQPLMDNLESATYEVFEKDPVKYSEYERAIHVAIIDKVPEEEKETKTVVVMVLGAGRGPLVRAALKAAEQAKRKIRLFAIEKNPNAVVTLLGEKESNWGDKVEVISTDMRKWTPPEGQMADIIVSELLGSFGDNELSPECLYDAQHLFKPDGISIPTSYTSWVGPIQSSKLYNEVRTSVDIDKPTNANFETPYVVHLQNITELAPPQPLFTFEHPRAENIDYNRYASRTFDVALDYELHGFGGYFECVLYKDVVISTNPSTHSKGMFSWFPIFFPLKAPLKISKGQQIELHFWRVNNGKEVWYEWNVSKPVSIPLHNPNGRAYTIGL